MRQTLRLLASVKPVAARYLEAGAPTGLTGVHTYPTPRSTLLYLYSSTLDKLQTIPETSVYRQSVEAVTKHRMALVQAVKPAGYDEWKVKAQALVDQHPEHFDGYARPTADGSTTAGVKRGGAFFVLRHKKPEVDERYQEWDGEENTGPELEGPRTTEERKYQAQAFKENPFEGEDVEWVDEPKLTIDQCVRIFLELNDHAFGRING